MEVCKIVVNISILLTSRLSGALAGRRLGTDNDEKGFFFLFKLNSPQPCHRLWSKKWYFSGKGVGFHNSDKNAVPRGKNGIPLLNGSGDFNSLKEEVKMGTFYQVKGYQFLYFEHTV